jgi:hypothetical protein
MSNVPGPITGFASVLITTTVSFGASVDSAGRLLALRPPGSPDCPFSELDFIAGLCYFINQFVSAVIANTIV